MLHPALPSDPGHALWKRDFTGASGLFAIVLKPVPHAALAAMLDGLQPVRHGLFLGRLRKPDPALRSECLSHGDDLAGRKDRRFVCMSVSRTSTT